MRFPFLKPLWSWTVFSGATLLMLAVSPALAQVEQTGHSRPSYCPPPPCPTPEVNPAPTDPSRPPTTTEPSPLLAMQPTAEFAPGTGAETVPAQGYIDNAVPRTLFRLRYDSAYGNNRPDRAEFFYAKCGCFRGLPAARGGDPNAPGPPLPETNVDFQDITSYLEVALNQRFSTFVEIPVRFLNPTVNDNTAGLGDLHAGVKYAFVANPGQFLTFQFKTFAPSGDSDRGLGTNNVELEPGLLAYQRIGDRLAVSGELRDWIPIDGTDFAGNVLRYGVGASYDLFHLGDVLVTPVGELVGWTVLGGKELDGRTGAILDADGDTIINAKLGLRFYMGDFNSLYLGYGRALTGEVWYKDMLRVEYRLAF